MNELRDARLIVDRVGVRHARDRGEAAGDGRGGAGRDRLLVLLAGLAQVHVHVDQAGDDHQAGGDGEHVRAFDRQIGADLRNHAIDDQQIARAIDPVRGIDDAPALQQ